ncbi:MAG TPA: maleylacetoacetate isomerase [Polyangiaceae bacterium]
MTDVVLYSYWRSSSSYRVRIALGHKGITYRTVPVNLLKKEQTMPEHVLRSATGYVPCLEIDRQVYVESVAIIELLEDLYPRPSLYPREPKERARVRAMVEIINAGIQPLQNLNVLEMHASDPQERTAWARHFNERGLQALERMMEENEAEGLRGRYAYGDFFTAVDAFLVPQVYSAKRFGVDVTRYPRVRQACDAALALPFVRDAAPERQPDAPKSAMPDLGPEKRDAILARVLEVLEPIASGTRLLEDIAWPRSVEKEFFAGGAQKLPVINYAIDRAPIDDAIVALTALHTELEGEHPLLRFLRRQCESFLDAQRLLLAVGTKDFYRLSVQLYGSAKGTAFDHDTTNLDLAEHVRSRVATEAQRVDVEELDTDAFVELMEERLDERGHPLAMEIIRDANLSAKVLCGRTRMRVREGARFSRAEAEGLFLHEIETHALTAQNGAAQKAFPLLRAGGPRTTRTQEGLAVFSELYGHALSTPRLLRLAERVTLVAMAEDGASFLDLYRHLVGRGLPERDAYFDAQRVCRGGLIEGGGPFTKDSTYLAGLMDVYNFLRAALRFQAPVLGSMLVCGRVALEDMEALLWLRAEGVLEEPKVLPRWLSRWDALVSYFAFTSFLNEVDVVVRPVSDSMSALVERAVDVVRASPPKNR